jgi:hypothetical protein
MIPSWGFVTKILTFGYHNFSCQFLHAAITSTIIGLDFFSANHLLEDPLSSLVVLDAATLQPINGQADSVCHVRSPPAIALCSISPDVCSFLAIYPTIISNNSTPSSPLHGVQNTTEMTEKAYSCEKPPPECQGTAFS